VSVFSSEFSFLLLTPVASFAATFNLETLFLNLHYLVCAAILRKVASMIASSPAPTPAAERAPTSTPTSEAASVLLVLFALFVVLLQLGGQLSCTINKSTFADWLFHATYQLFKFFVFVVLALSHNAKIRLAAS